MSETSYPGLLDRVKALFIDSIVVILAVTTITDIFSYFDTIPVYSRVIAFVCIFILYDPLLISLFGATVGHKMSRISVKREQNDTRNLSFINALIRFVVKFFLGWISFLTVTGNNKRRAIHDFAASSVVLYVQER